MRPGRAPMMGGVWNGKREGPHGRWAESGRSRAFGWTHWSRLEAVVMMAPVVYLVAAALLVGLILFLTRRRGRVSAGRRPCRTRAFGPAFSGLLSFGRPSRRDSCACAGKPGAVGEERIGSPGCVWCASDRQRACAYVRDG